MNTKAKNTVSLLIEEALNKGNLSILEELIHPEYQYESPTETMRGIDQLRAFILALRSAFPDLWIKIEDQIGEEQKVCTRISMTGTHLGEFLDIPATERSIHLQGVINSTLKNGLIYREWELLDQLSLLQQLGLAAQEG